MISQTIIYLGGTVVDPAGRGIEGVAVSNGELIERTDAAGAYEIEAQPGIHRFLTVTCPEGFRPADSHFRRIRGVENGTVHFELTPLGKPSGRFAAAHITDLHLTTGEDGRHRRPGDNLASPDLLAGDIAEVEEELSPAFMLATGDLTNAGSIAELEAFRAVAEAAATPMHLGFGGHDANVLQARTPGKRVEDDSEVRDWLDDSNAGVTLTRYFERILGPTHYSFDYGSWHFVLYPNEEYEFSVYDQLRKERWLEADLTMQPAGRPIVVGVHAPPRIDLLERLAKYDVRLVLHGHTPHEQGIPSSRHRHRFDTAPVLGGQQHRSARLPGPAFRRRQVRHGAARCRRALEGALAGGAGRGRSGSRTGRERAAPDLGNPSAGARPSGRTGPLRRRPHSEPAGRRRRQGERCLPRRPRRRFDRLALPHRFGDPQQRRRRGWGVVRHVELRPAVVSRRGDGRSPLARGHPRFSERWMAGSPAVAGGVVYAGAKSGYGAHDAGTGEPLWFRRFSGTLDLIADPTGDKWGAWFTPIVCGGLLICLVPRRALTALDAKAGESSGSTRSPTARTGGLRRSWWETRW